MPPPAVLAILLAAAVFLLRLPSAFIHHELNPDESLMLIQGVKFLLDPVPWRSVDGFSSGPLNSWIVSALLAAGLKPTYSLLHLLASSLISIQVVVMYRTLLHLTTWLAAALGVLPMLLFYGLASEANFLSYSSELLPVLLFAFAFHSLIVWWKGSSPHSCVGAFAGGIALGCSLWAKSQALPIAGAIGIVFLAAIVTTERNWLRQAASLSAGVVLPALLILAPVIRAGVMGDFWNSYILGNLAYAGQVNIATTLLHIAPALSGGQMLPLSILLVIAAATLIAQPSLAIGASSKEDLWILGSLCAYLAACLFAVCRPSATFPHYQILLVHPMTCLSTLLIARVLRPAEFGRTRLPRFTAYALTPVVALFAMNTPTYVAYASNAVDEANASEMDANRRIAGIIRDLVHHGRDRRVSIWGWMPGAYVDSGTIPATRDAICGMVITRGPMQNYYRSRFVGDLRRAMPAVFVDAVVPGAFLWHPGFKQVTPNDWTEKDGYESDPALRDFIDRNYMQVKQLQLRPGARPVRFFVRANPPILISD
jgi:hypothetical protein